MICLCEDDCIIHDDNDSIITDFIKMMRSKYHLFHEEGGIEKFLGVHINMIVSIWPTLNGVDKFRKKNHS